MSTPRRHHHNPVFQLRRWADPDDGKVCVFRRIRRNIVVCRWSPKATGYERDLYAIKSWDDVVARQVVETNYMQRIDDAAARALASLEEEGSKPLDPTVRNAWVTFVTSLFYRNPRGVARLRKYVESEGPELPELEGKYRALRGSGDPPDLPSFLRSMDESFYEEAWARLFVRLITSQRIGTQLAKMEWCILKSNRELVIGDDPVLHSNGMVDRDSYIALPIGPDRCFVAANSSDVIEYLRMEAESGRIANAFNAAQARQAIKRVFARNSTHKLLFRRHLGVKHDQSSALRLTWRLPLRQRIAPLKI